MTRSSNRLLDVIRTNTQVKIYLTVNEQNTVKMLEKASGVFSYDERSSRLDVNDIRDYSADRDCGICWITRESGFTRYGGNWFGIRTGYHITPEEFARRDSAPWPEPTGSTIVAERNIDGERLITPGRATEDAEVHDATPEAFTLKVPADSKWAVRLREVFNQRYKERSELNGI